MARGAGMGLALGCSHRPPPLQIEVPPRAQLASRPRLGIVEFGGVVEPSSPGSLFVGPAFESIDASANVTGQLETRLYEGATGVTLWSRWSTASAPVASLGAAWDVGSSFGIGDPHQAYAEMVRSLVSEQHYDFYPSWQTR